MSEAFLAVPGDLATLTGGYAYARRLLAEARDASWPLRHLALPRGFPEPDGAALAQAERQLSALPARATVIIDGLALGVLPAGMLRSLPARVVALCHHPLARETGLTAERARRLAESEREALASVGAVIATSEATARELRRDYGVRHVSVARPGTEPQPFAEGSGGPAPLILSVGSLTPRKGHATLVRALARNAALDWQCRIVGPADRDPAEASRLAALIGETGLSERIALTGAIDAEALHRAYHRADLFALPSRHEGFGMVFAEAVAHGLPVLGPDIPPVAEATAGGALLLPPEDEDAWADALRDLLSRPDRRAALARQAHAAANRLPRWSETLNVVRGTVETLASAVP